MSQLLLIESQYLPPISSFCHFSNSDQVMIDQFEFYEKKSFRNRAYICNTRGKFRLTIPLEKGKNQKKPMKEVKISRDVDWQRHHWQSIMSAYSRSPFFEFYADGLNKFYQKDYTYLIDLNQDLINFLSEEIGLSTNFTFSETYIDQVGDEMLDLRSEIQPNKKEKIFLNSPQYQQVFSDRLPFIENLSILDLLFNQGPQSKVYLKSISKG